MTEPKVCICGHAKSRHLRRVSKSSSWCRGMAAGRDWHWPCGCEGWTGPPDGSERLVFGVHRLPREVAESAPAWAREPETTE